MHEGDIYYLPDFNNSATSCTIGDDDFSYKWFKTTSADSNARDMDFTFSNAKNRVKYTSYTSGTQVQSTIEKAPQNNPTKITAPSGCTATVSNGTTTITSTGLASSGNLTQNSTATVTITPPTGKKVTTATLTGGTSQTLNLISNHNGTYSATYTVPSNTTETAITFSEPVDKSSYKVNVVSSDVSEGTVAATVGGSALDPNTSYPEDTAITLTATEGDGFSFVKWDYKTTTDSSANPATYYVNGEDATGTTINITGEFGEHGYYIKIGTTGSYTAMTLLGNGKYISTAKVGSGNDPANKFMIKRSSDNNYANPGDSDYKFKADWISGSPVSWVGNEPDHYFYQENVSSNAALYVLYDPATDKISFSDDPQGHTPTTVLVKRGAVFSDGDGANISSTGTSVKNGTNVVSATVAGANKTSGFSDQWKETNSSPAVYYVRQVDFTAAEVGKGAKITVATTVTDSTLKVVGFVVNGESVLGSDITVSGNTYTMTYTIPEYPDTKIEITPVYAKKSGTIRFYVEGVDGEIRTKWGDTVYCYAYYGSADTTATYGLGTWPGQPLLYDNGRYFIDLAEYDGNNKINGIALNNGTWDTVHAYRILGSQTDIDKNTNQCQSYDYDDFEKINNLENEKKQENSSYVKADIIFEMKSKGVVTPENSNFGNTFDTSGSSYPSTIDVNNFTGWEYLTDYYGNRVDVFGNIIDPTDTHYNDEPYRLVSQGYDQNNVGYFATAWVVYQKSGSNYNKLTSVGSHGYVGMDSESKFLDSGLENQDGWSALKGMPAKITYEYGVYQEKGNGGQSDDGGPKPATRYDGRWYASKVLDVKAHVLIEYGRSEHSTFTPDYFQEGDINYKSASGYDPSKVEGLVTKTKAHFSETPYSTESKKSTAKNADGSSVNKFNFVAEDDTEGKYTFIGWYKYNAKGEVERVSTKKNYSVDVKNSEELIARFIKTPAGSVIISHDLLTGSEGLGTTLNSVSIVESDKLTPVAAVDPNPITSSSTGAAKIDSKAITVENAFDDSNADRGRLVKIVLNTTPNGATFQHFHYDINKSGNPAQLTASAPGSPFVIDVINEANATATIYIPLSYFFKEENGDKIFDEDKDTLKFYSELQVNPVHYKIKYVFPGRSYLIGEMAGLSKYGNDMAYTVTGEGLPTDVLEDGHIKLATVQLNQPYEKNFMQSMTWDYNNVSYSKEGEVYTATVTATNGNLPTKTVTFYFPYESDSYQIKNYNDETTVVGTIYGPKYTVPAKDEYTTKSYTVAYQGNPIVYAKRTDAEGHEYLEKFRTYAAEKLANDETFLYWSIRAQNRNAAKVNGDYPYEEVARCYDARFSYTIFDDYKVYAVYSGDKGAPESADVSTDVYTYINFLDYSRNHWNNSERGSAQLYPDYTEGDIVWTDFDVAFENGNQLINGTSKTEVGVLIEKVGAVEENYKLNPSTEDYATNYKHYVDEYKNSADTWKANAKEFLKTAFNSNDTYSRKIIDKNDLTNKGRCEYGYGLFVNNGTVQTEKRDSVYRAYSYIKVAGENGTYDIILCETPVYFSVQNEANK